VFEYFNHRFNILNAAAAAFTVATNLCMAVSFLTHELSELCLGKPPLKSISTSATVVEAIEVLRSSDESFVSVWNCDHSEFGRCECVGKICMVDVIVFLCKEENLSCPSSALKASIANVLPKVHGLVVHLEPSSRYFIIYLIIYTFSSLLQYFIMLGMIW
jgi:hypothetical protein